MIEIFVFVILVAMFFVDHRLHTLVKLNREMLEAMKVIRNRTPEPAEEANAQRPTPNVQRSMI